MFNFHQGCGAVHLGRNAIRKMFWPIDNTPSSRHMSFKKNDGKNKFGAKETTGGKFEKFQEFEKRPGVREQNKRWIIMIRLIIN